MIEDSELLRRYAREKSQAAFAELVQRHVNLVYAGALRRVGGDTHLAEDVTQRVFTVLAAAAGQLSARPVLGGWLHITTRNIAAQLVRTERRRTAREQEALTMNEPNADEPSGSADWERLRPVIDAALDELEERDREAVIMRYLECRSLAEVGVKLQLTENAARMRVDRALERMQGLLTRRGVTSTIGALSLALAGEASVTAPAGLAAVITGGALTTGAAVAGTAVWLAFMNTKLATAIAAVIAAVAVGVAVSQNRLRQEEGAELVTVRQAADDAAARLHELKGQLQAEKARVQALEKDNEALLAVVERTQVNGEAQAKADAEAKQPVTHDAVDARFKRGQALARSGNLEAALADFLWCYDEGMVRVSGFTGVRLSFLTGQLGKLAAKYPPAQAALQERRDRAEQVMRSSANEAGAAMEAAALNKALGESDRNLVLFDQLPAGDRRRSGLGVQVYDQLLAARRYTDAASVRPYEQMAMLFDALTAERLLPPGTPNAEMMRAATRSNAVTSMAKNIEVLAGAGQLDHARAFAEKLIAYDNTAETKALVQESATRAGHPELLATPLTR